jgi:DNA-binding CsgD family transcriptional regulator
MAAVLFGRNDERAHLQELLDGATSGPVGCVVEGMPGIGKTSLWRESVEGARRRGYQVLETAPSEPERSLAWSGLGDLFQRLPDEALNALPGGHADALRSALLLGELPGGSRGVQAVPRAVLGVLGQLCAGGPLLIAIDDEQWLDPASARALSFALCRLREDPIAVILTRRSETAGTLSAELSRRFGGRGLETVSLQPLPIGTIKMLLEARLKRAIPRPLLRRIHQGAGGNPLYALATALELEARQASGDRVDDLPIPRTLLGAIELRLRHLDPRAHPAMLAIAALSQPTLATLQAVIPKFALSDLESAERARVIEISGGRLCFTHPLLASTHYSNTPVSKRRELHRRLATVLDDDVQRAQHLALGAEAPDRDIADRLERAAGLAARRGATESAAQLLEDAAGLTPLDQPDARSARIVAAAEHRFNSGEVSRARAMLEEVLPDLGPGSLRARLRLRLAEIQSNEPAVAVEVLEAALADAGEDDSWRIKIESELTTMTSNAGRLVAARAHAESAVLAGERLGDPGVVGRALGELLVTFVCAGDPLQRDVLKRLSALEDCAATTTYHQPSTTIGLALWYDGDVEAGRPLIERAAARALSRGEEWDRLGLLLVLARLEWEAGNQRLALEHRQAAEETMGEFAEGVPWLIEFDATCALERGELAIARALAEEGFALADRTGMVWQATRMIPILAEVELLSGQPEPAHVRLAQLQTWLLSSGFGPAGPSKARIWSQDVEALIAMGRLGEAGEVLAELHVRARASERPYAQALAWHAEGLLCAARGSCVDAIEAMDTALVAHARCDRPFEHGRTLVEKGSIERRARRKAAAKQTLEHALSVLEPLGANLWTSRARDELQRIGLRGAKATEGLTPAQTRVAELVADGLTNPQIAQQLHMSLRTVESHLTRVYREHGVTSRSQLARALTAA